MASLDGLTSDVATVRPPLESRWVVVRTDSGRPRLELVWSVSAVELTVEPAERTGAATVGAPAPRRPQVGAGR